MLPNGSARWALEWVSRGGTDKLSMKMFRNGLVECLLEKALINLVVPWRRGLDQKVFCDPSTAAADGPYHPDSTGWSSTGRSEKESTTKKPNKQKRWSFRHHTAEREASKHCSEKPKG